MNKLFDWIDSHEQDIVATYKKLHMTPELGSQERETAAFLAGELRTLGFEVVEGFAETGVLGTLKGSRPGLTFALRADMDALPIQEETGLPYASTRPGVMHACGHDAHCTMALFAAKALLANGGVRRGTLKVLFQPAEEIGGKGALEVLESGVLQGVDELVGVHLRNDSEAKVGEAVPGVKHSAARKVRAKIHGTHAHGAWPHRGANAISALAAIVNNVNAVHADPRVIHSVKPTGCSSGNSALNVIPPYAEVTFDLRSQTNEVMQDLQEKVERAIKAGAEGIGCTAEVAILSNAPAAELDDGLIEDAADSIAAVTGKRLPAVCTPGAEDFHMYAAQGGIKSGFIGVGGDMAPGGHTPTMKVDLRALPIGVKILAHLAAKKVG